MERLGVTVVLAVVAVLLAGCGGGTGGTHADTAKVSRASMGPDWPFTVDHGELSCAKAPGTGKDLVVFTAPDGKRYAVNGSGRATGKYAELTRIWADDPDIQFAKKKLGPVIAKGLRLCG